MLQWPQVFSLCWSCFDRCCCHKAAEQEVLSHGVLHSSQKQYEGYPCLLYTYYPPVPLLRPAPPNVTLLPRRTWCCGCTPWPAHPPPHTARLGIHPQQQPWSLWAAQGLPWGSPRRDELGFKLQPQPYPKPSIHPECLRLSEPLFQPTSWHIPTPVPLSNVSSKSALHLPLPSNSPQ